MAQTTLIEASWHELLSLEFEKPYMRQLDAFLIEEKRLGKVVYPPNQLIFNAFCHSPIKNVNVVIIGQDPYHSSHQAHGLCFSVPMGIPAPPSLQNIFKELSKDLGLPIPAHGNLERWAKQGVLLLNATLTVRENEPRSHYGKGWEAFTDHVIRLLVQLPRPIVFVLWGKSALEKWRLISDQSNNMSCHLVLIAAHPSPLSAYSGFFGCKHFSQINAFLQKNHQQPIDWSL